MPASQKILLLDDEQDLLDLYRDLLLELPSKPEVHTSNSGARAIALLESESFSMLISDLRCRRGAAIRILQFV